MKAIQQLFPDAKDARFGLMYGFGVSLKLQQKIVIKRLFGYDREHAQEFLRTALIKVLKIPNVKNETNNTLKDILTLSLKIKNTKITKANPSMSSKRTST